MRIVYFIISTGLFFIFFLFGNGHSQAQNLQYKLYTLPEISISDKSIYSMAQDKSGFVYVKTRHNLFRFDGSHAFETGDIFRLSVNTRLFQTHSGEMLILYESGVYQLESARDFQTKKIVDCRNPVTLYEDTKGGMWISLASGEILYLHDNKASLSHPDSVPGFFFEDKNGKIVFISEKGSLFSYINEKINVLPVNNPVQHIKITGLLKKDKDIAWLNTTLGVLELKQKNDTSYVIKPVLPELSAVTSLFMSSDKQVYIGTQGRGLFRINANDTTYHTEEVFFTKSSYNNSDYTEALPFKNINHIFEDKEGHLWVSNELGIALLYPGFFVNPHPKATHYILNGMTELKDGSFCFGSVNQLVLLNPFKNTMTPGYRFAEGSIASVTSENNRIWTGNTNGNLYCTTSNTIVKTLRFDKRGGSIFSIYSDRKNRVWFCQVFKDKPLPGITVTDSTFSVRYYGRDKGLKGRVLVARESRKGIVYLGGIGKDTYLYRFDEKQDRFINLSLPLPFENKDGFEVHDITIDSQENIWLATSKGVLKYNNNTIKRIDLGEYLTNTEIRSIIADKSDQIWIATDAFGLLLYKNGVKLRYTVENGLVNNVLWYRLLFLDKSGRLWVGTNANYVVSGRNTPIPVKTQKPVISKFLCNEIQNIDTSVKEIRLPYHGSLEASFISLSYPSDAIVYQITTKEIDKLGVSVTAKNSVKLSHLTTGSYEMEIKAKQLGYAWSEPLIIRFNVERVWYRSWWAYVGYILTCILIIRWIIVVYTNYLRKERERLNEIVAKKTKELIEKNQEISEQNAEITAQNEELLSQQEEITSQRDVLATQNQYLHEARKTIEEQNQEIKSHNDYLEKEVKFRTQELEEYNQQLEQFAFITAHNLRAPVARILGLGTVLGLSKDNLVEQQLFVEKMIFAARELDQVIKDLNMILTIRKSYVNVNTPVNLTEEIEKMKKSLREEINETQTTIIEDLEPIPVFQSFPPYIESILYNLVSNAIKYGHPARKPVIEIKMRWIDDMVHLTVRDNGLGMDLNAYRDKVFTLYKRFHLHLEGKGMGLYIVKTQVNSLGGKIDVESSINEGTIFHILLPATASKVIHTSI